MTNTISNRLGIALVSGVALTGIVLSQIAFAQRGERNATSGISALIGRGGIRASDDRFQPAAAMVINAASGGGGTAGLRGGVYFDKTMTRNWIDHTLFWIPSSAARGGEMRPLTPSEALLMEELFSKDLSKVRGIEVNENGIQGSVSPRDLGMKPEQLTEMARARAKARLDWYQQAAGGLH
ncbi:MAG: hypothetical protein ACHQ50_07445 [Fimbriimonadales bacterium]